MCKHTWTRVAGDVFLCLACGSRREFTKPPQAACIPFSPNPEMMNAYINLHNTGKTGLEPDAETKRILDLINPDAGNP